MTERDLVLRGRVLLRARLQSLPKFNLESDLSNLSCITPLEPFESGKAYADQVSWPWSRKRKAKFPDGSQGHGDSDDDNDDDDDDDDIDDDDDDDGDDDE
jgi:hypothetical protein